MKNKILLTFIIYILFINHVPVYGETSNQEQDGKSIAFILEQSVPADSAKNVSLDTEIKLLFNKNVVNMSVKENNYNCIKLLDAKNNIIPCELIFADDQIEPDKKREIILRPINYLTENTDYKVEISENMMAKNGNTLGATLTILFTTLKSTSTSAETEKTEIINTVKTNNNSKLNTSTASDKNEEPAVVLNDISQNGSDSNDLNKESSLNNLNNTEDSTKSDTQSISKEDNDSNNSKSNNTNSSSIIEDKEETKSNSNEKNNNYIYLSIFVVLLISFIYIFAKIKRKL